MAGRWLAMVACMIIICSCSKNSDSVSPYQGLWVEKTNRLDTFDFEKGNSFGSISSYPTVFFRSKPFTDLSLNPNFPINNSAIYSYYVKSDSIFLRNFLSSSMNFPSFRFQFNNDQRSFQIGKFYTRTGLASVLEFERIQ